GLFQSSQALGRNSPTAGLKQPTLRRMRSQTLGRRNAAPVQGTTARPGPRTSPERKMEDFYQTLRHFTSTATRSAKQVFRLLNADTSRYAPHDRSGRFERYTRPTFPRLRTLAARRKLTGRRHRVKLPCQEQSSARRQHGGQVLRPVHAAKSNSPDASRIKPTRPRKPTLSVFVASPAVHSRVLRKTSRFYLLLQVDREVFVFSTPVFLETSFMPFPGNFRFPRASPQDL